MISGAPWMLVTAFVDAAVQEEFNAWHRDAHMPLVLSIPGVVSGRRLSGPPFGPNYAAIYVFENDAALRTALASPEAQEARGDWQRWSDRIRDLSVHFYAEYAGARTLYRQN